MSSKTEQVVYLNNCELLIESFSFKARGTYYFVWKKGKKTTQSNKYQITNEEPVSPKDMLSLSLKVYYQGNVPLQRHTHLILFNGAGQEIDRVKLMINQWTTDVRQMIITIGGGTMKLKVKRKGVMKLQKFHRFRSQVQETSEDQAARFLKKGSNKVATDRDQVLRLTKQLQDLNFLVTKLKEERNSGLQRIKKLEDQLSKITDRMVKDLIKTRDYFQMKMQMRQSVYKEQIQQLVSSFNRNYDLNMEMMKNLVSQKFQYEEQLRQLKESNHEYITQQSQSFERLIADMQKHKQIVDQELKDSNEKLHESQQTIDHLNDQIDRLNQELQQQKQNFLKLQQKGKQDEERHELDKNTLNIKIAQFQLIVQDSKNAIQSLKDEVLMKQEQITALQIMVENKEATEQEYKTATYNWQLEKSSLNQQIESEKMKIQGLEAENMSKQTQLDAIKIQLNGMIQRHELEINEAKKLIETQMESDKQAYNELNQRYLELTAEEGELRRQILQLQSDKSTKEIEVGVMHQQVEHYKLLVQQLNHQMAEASQEYKKSQAQMTERLADYINKSNQLEVENMQIHNELKDLTIRSQEEIQKMKGQYFALTQSNKHMFEDEIQMLRKDKQEIQSNYLNMRTEYEQEIASIIENHKSQIEELQKMYRQDHQKQQKEIFQMIQQKNLLKEEFEAFKFQVHMDQVNRQQENQIRNQKKLLRRNMAIQQIEQNPDQEIEEQEEDIIIPKKKIKRKTTKMKPIIIESSQEKSSQHIQEAQSLINQQGQDGESIFQLLKKKKSEGTSNKGKLKLKKKARNEQVLQSLKLSEEQQHLEDLSLTNQPIGKKDKTAQKKKQEEEVFQKPKSVKKKQTIKVEDEQQSNDLLVQSIQMGNKKKINKKKVVNFQQHQNQQQLLQKIQELQQENNLLKSNEEKIKVKYQKQQTKLKKKIQDLEHQITELQTEIQGLRQEVQDKNQVAKIKPKIERKIQKIEVEQIQQKEIKTNKKVDKQDQSPKFKPNRQPSPRSETKKVQQQREVVDDQKLITKVKLLQGQKQTLRKKIQLLQSTLAQKQLKIQYLQNEVNNLNKQGNYLKAQLGQKSNMLQSKVLQRKQDSYQISFGGENALKQSIMNLQEKVSDQRQKYHQLKLRYDQRMRENEDLVSEIKKLKRLYEQLEERERRKNVPRSIQQMQSQIQDANRKVLETSKTLNQVRLQRDSFEQQIRLVRKKLTQTTKANHQLQVRASQSERQADDLKRKQQRYKRQIEEWQQQSKRLKQVNKKTLQQLGQVRKSQSQFFIQRKKILDQVVKLEEVIANKQMEIVKINKEMDKIKNKMNQSTEMKQGRQRQYRGEMQKLQIERSKLERKNRENQETIRLLKQKLDVADKQAKKNLEERNKSYGQKLKRYVQQIISVKQVVEEYQQENQRLKIHNSEFFQQNQLLKVSYQKLQAEHQQLLNHNQKLNQLIQENNKKIIQMETNIKNYMNEEEKNKILITSLKKQIDNERIVSRKKSEKMQVLQQQNQRFLYDIKNLKLKLGQFQMNYDDKQKLQQEVYKSHQTIDSLQQKVNKISEQYHIHLQKYVYTREDVEKALRELKQHQDRIKETEFAKIIQELDQSSAAKRQKMEAQLLNLYSQNEKLRVSVHKANQDYLQAQLEIAELDKLRQKNKRLQKQKSMLEKRVLQLTDELKVARQECRRTQIKFNQSLRNQEGKSTQNVVLLQRYDQVSKKYQQLNEMHSEQKIENKRMLDKYKALIEEKDENIERLCTELQTLNNKLLANQLQINRLKELEGFNSQDSKKKIQKLESKIQEINEINRQKQRQTEVTFKSQIKQLKSKNAKLQEELMQKLRRLEELNQGLIMLQRQVQQLTDELTNARSQIAQDGEVYTMQVNKLRNEMRQMELTYDRNMHSLEEQLSAMSKQLTSIKYARQNRENTANSRLRGSRQSQIGDDKTGKRYQEKIKLKQKRIEQLKETILAYEEKIMQLTRKDNRNQEIQLYQSKLSTMQRQYQTLIQRKNQQLNRLIESNKTLDKQVENTRNREEELIMKIEEKDLQIETLKSELSTIKKLYTDLQKEIDKRKQTLSRQIQSQFNFRVEYEKAQRQLNESNEKLTFISRRMEELEASLKKKEQQNSQHRQTISVLQKQRLTLLDHQRKKLQGESFAKLKIKQIELEVENTKNQNRKLRNELSINMKQIANLKAELNHKSNSLSDLVKELQNNDKIIANNQNLLSKYIRMNQQCLEIWGINLDALIATAVEYKNEIKMKEEEIQKLNEEIEELKFLFENKMIDYEEVKKENYQLNLRDQEKEQLQIELVDLRQRYVNIERQKIGLQFREQSIKMTLQHIINNDENKDLEFRQVKKKIRSILNNNF